jgi:hypothetical protein
MCFQGKILELRDQIEDFFVLKNKIFFNEGRRLHGIDKQKINKIIEAKNNACYIDGMERIWCDDGSQYQCFKIDGQRETSTFSDGAIKLFYMNHCFYSFKNIETKKYNLAVKDFASGKTAILKDSFNSYAVCDGYLFSRKTSKGIWCFDLELKSIWSYEFDRDVDFAYGNLLPYFYQNLVILNIGEDKQKGGDGQIVALSKSDGSLVWKRHFETEPTFIVIEDKVYATENAQMTVLDAATGKTLVDHPSGFETSAYGDSLWSNGRELFMVNMTLSKIRIFSEDGKTIHQELKIPEPFSPLRRKHFVSHNGFYYLPLGIEDMSLNGAVYGLLILSFTEDKQKVGIIVEPRPYNQVLTKQTKDGQDYCHVIIKDSDFENVLKYGPILLKEYANVKGSQVWSDNRRNHKFNGMMVFSTNIEDFSDEENQKIALMLKDAEEWFDIMAIRAGNRKAKIKIELGPSTSELDET